MKKTLLRVLCLIITLTIILPCTLFLSSCSNNKKRIIIYTSAEDYIIEYMQEKMEEKFPQYKILFEYKSTGDHAASLMAAGKNSECHISFNMEYAYAEKIADAGVYADLTGIIDFDAYTEDAVQSKYYAPENRTGGAIILNMDVINEKGLDIPTSYADLLDPQYKGLISMPNPKASGTGYIFLLSLINAWGEEAAFDYFDKLSQNILSFTSSGSGPVNALVGKEVAIGLGITYMAASQINEGENLRIIYFDEGSPYSLYGMSIIAGNETDADVVEVFKYLAGELNYQKNELYCPEKMYKDADFKAPNYPENIIYADMTNNSPERKEDILSKWNH